MRRILGLSAALGACLFTLAPVVHAADGEPPAFNPAGLSFKAGNYRCELNRSVNVRHVDPDMKSAVVHWDRRDYTLRAVNTHSGALRYEDAASGLVWLVIVGKSMLLDTRQGKQLANECKV